MSLINLSRLLSDLKKTRNDNVFKGVIFDLDGTILNTDLYVVLNYARLFKKYAPNRIPSLKELIYLSGPALEDVFSEYLPEEDPEMLREDFVGWAKDNCNVFSSTYPEEVRVLDNFIRSGIKLGLVTNKSTGATYSCLRYFDLLDKFSSIFPAERCLRKKPDPWAIEECVKELKIEKSDTIYIGDDFSDIRAGKAAGIKTGLVRFGLKEVEGTDPDYSFDSYSQIERTIMEYGKHQ